MRTFQRLQLHGFQYVRQQFPPAFDTFISMIPRNFEMIILENIDLHSHPNHCYGQPHVVMSCSFDKEMKMSFFKGLNRIKKRR